MTEIRHFDTKVTPEGRVLVPVDVRRFLGISAGDRVRFIVDGSGVRLVSARSLAEELWAANEDAAKGDAVNRDAANGDASNRDASNRDAEHGDAAHWDAAQGDAAREADDASAADLRWARDLDARLAIEKDERIRADVAADPRSESEIATDLLAALALDQQ